MAVDVNIHIVTPAITPEVLKAFRGATTDEIIASLRAIDEMSDEELVRYEAAEGAASRAAYEAVISVPDVWIGRESGAGVVEVWEMIPDLTLIDDALIASVARALAANERAAEVVKFLEAHKGEHAFTVGW